MTSEEIIREAFFALCEYQNPSLSKDAKRAALGRCWEILAAGVRQEKNCESHNRANNWSYAEEKELAK